MQCLYCDSQVTPYPADGICPHCGAKLRPDNTPTWQSVTPPPPVASPGYRRPVFVPQPGVNCCPRCHSAAISWKKRGFGWAAGLIGFLFLPPFGILFGLIGKDKRQFQCASCRHTWTVK